MTDLELAAMKGISLTQLRRERAEATRRIVEPAVAAFRAALSPTPQETTDE